MIRHNQRDEVVLCRIAVHAHAVNTVTCLYVRLDIAQGDVLAVSQLEQILLAI